MFDQKMPMTTCIFDPTHIVVGDTLCERERERERERDRERERGVLNLYLYKIMIVYLSTYLISK